MTHSLPRTLLRPVGRAISDFRMIRKNDRILLGVSGGKDSLTLLHLLSNLRRYSPTPFDLGAVTIDPQVQGFDPSHLVNYLAELEIPFFLVREPIFERARDHMTNNSYCSWCARMKRGAMYATARKNGYNVLAMAQHLDDLAESFLMSAFHGGRLQTMKAHYRIDEGDLRVIRPMVYVRERQTRDFARRAGMPVITENCPACFSMPTQREHMKTLLAREEAENHGLFKSLLSAMKPLMSKGSSDVL